MQSRLPSGGVNRFQEIKAVMREAEQRGVKLLKLSIGQPTGPALLSARKAAAEAVMSEDESMHEYQDNGSPGVPDFAKRFVQAHAYSLSTAGVSYLPIPGIKPMLGLVVLACRAGPDTKIRVATTTNPGYPTPADWCRYLGVDLTEPPLTPENSFRFSEKDIEGANLVMVNYPHNPTGQIACIGWWERICTFCSKHDIRLFNDAAYYALSYNPASATLAHVARDFRYLSWAEAFSASKVISNGTGWRIGAMVGSPDFIQDIATIKGNSDSGFVAPMAAGVIATLENDKPGIVSVCDKYRRRFQVLIGLLEKNGMRLAIGPQAGFFTLWLTPKKAFGEEVKDAKHFNFMMIERTGVVGVHFEPYIRYAVVGDIETMADGIDRAFQQAQVSY